MEKVVGGMKQLFVAWERAWGGAVVRGVVRACVVGMFEVFEARSVMCELLGLRGLGFRACPSLK